MASAKKKIVNTYTEEMNVVLCRQILGERPYEHKKYSGELTKTWNKITEALSATYDDLNVSTRNIRDHLDAMLKYRTKQRNAERRLSGVDIEVSELEVLLDTIQEDIEGCASVQAETSEKEKEKEEKDKKAAEEVRNVSLETYKRRSSLGTSSESDSSSPPASAAAPPKRRRTGTETMAFLMSAKEEKQTQHDSDMKFRTEELALRNAERENTTKLVGLMFQSQQQAQQQMQQQMQQQQQQQLQLQQQMQQQMQQQSTLFAALIEKITK